MRGKTFFAAGAVLAMTAAPFTLPAQAADRAPVVSTDPDVVHANRQPLTPAQIADRRAHLQYRDGGQGKVVGMRKATRQDVASGLAVNTLSTVYICAGSTNLRNPLSNSLDRDNWIGVGWDESSDAKGSPMAHIHSGSAPLVVHNDKTYIIFWSAAQWENVTGSLYQWVRWYYNQTMLNAVGANGGELGMAVQADGNASQQGSVWYNQEHHASGFDTWVAYTITSIPALDIYLWGSGSNAKKTSASEVYIEATNSSPCGHVGTVNY